MITLQDMPDDILELIYSNLSINDSVNTNIALHKNIIKSKVTEIYDTEKFKLIPKCYHKYINIIPILEIEESELKLYSDVYGIKIWINTNINLLKFNNLKSLFFYRFCSINADLSVNNVDISSLTTLTYLNCPSSQIDGINNLTNLIELYCEYSNIKYVNNLTNLTHLNCTGTLVDNIDNLTNLEVLYMDETYITKINHLIKLRILACEGTEIDDISNLVNLEELYCTESYIENIDKLINLKQLHCYDTKIRSIKYNTKLEELYTNVSIEIPEEMKSRIKIE
jgi:hypothetical protein